MIIFDNKPHQSQDQSKLVTQQIGVHWVSTSKQNSNIDGGADNITQISRNHVLLTKLPLLPKIPLQNIAFGSPAHSQIKLEEIPNIKISTRILFSIVLKFFKQPHQWLFSQLLSFIDPTMQIFRPLEGMKYAQEITNHQNTQTITQSKAMDTI